MQSIKFGLVTRNCSLVLPLHLEGGIFSLQLVLADESGQVWMLPEKIIARPQITAELRIKERPGQGHLFLGFPGEKTLWGLEVTELQNAAARASIILPRAKDIHEFITGNPLFEDYWEFCRFVRTLQGKQGQCERGTNTFEKHWSALIGR